MADNKKKPSLFTLKRWNSQKMENSPKTPPVTPSQDVPKFFRNQTSGGHRLALASNGDMKPRRSSAGGIKELVQCPLCLEVLHNAKMLPCQHTFCMACLTVYVADSVIIECPICASKIQTTGPNFLEKLPSNLYINSLLNLFGVKGSSSNSEAVTTGDAGPAGGGTETVATGGVDGGGAGASKSTSQSVELFAGGVRCSYCQTMCDSDETTACVHCKLNFCTLCWSQHVDDMRMQIGCILKQLDSAQNRLEHKTEYFKDHCERIIEQITIAADEKIVSIIETRDLLLQKAAKLQKTGEMQALALKISMEDTKDVANETMTSKDENSKSTVLTFVNLHHNAIQLLSDVTKWDVKSFFFDKENFSIEEDATTPCDAESEDPLPEGARQNNPLESEESLAVHYRSRNFVAHHMWRKVSRPAGVAVSPWNNDLYVCGMDMHAVLVVERSQAKIVARLSCEEMLCPVHVAFMKGLGEIYVTDKWKHCIHVFSKDGEHLRSIGQKGSRDGMFRSPEGIATDNIKNHIYVVDTGNDRVQIIQPDGKFVDQIGVMIKSQPLNTGSVWENKDIVCTELSAPTSVAVTKDRVIILDSGHRRVKIYNKADKSKIGEFGAMGQRKGQFRQPEVLAVDSMGFILVGDSGNCRVQVFKPNGQLVRVFGGLGTGPSKFGWISGIHVTKELDVIISDTKNHCVNFY